MRRIGVLLESRWDTTLIASHLAETGLGTIVESGRGDLIAALLSAMTGFRETEVRGRTEVVPNVDGYWLREAFERHGAALAAHDALAAAKVAIQRIEELEATGRSRLAHFDYDSLEEDGERAIYRNEFSDILVRFARDMSLEAIQGKPACGRSYVEHLVSSEVVVVRKLALVLVRRNWNQLEELFWLWPANLFDDIDLHFEICSVLEEKSCTFSAEQVTRLVRLVETATFPRRGPETGEKRTTFVAFWRMCFLFAMGGSGQALVTQQMEHYSEVSGEEPRKVQRPQIGVAARVEHLAPVTADEMLDMRASDILAKFREFPYTGDVFGHSRMGLVSSLSSAVARSPERFVQDIAAFSTADPDVKASLLQGLSRAWEGEGNFDWEPVLDFALNSLSDEGLWEENYSGQRLNPRASLQASTAGLIYEGAKADAHSMPWAVRNPALQIVEILLENAAPRADCGETDVLTVALNSQQGHALNAAMSLSLRWARKTDAEKEKEWPRSIREDFERRLVGQGRSLEFSVMLGQWLPQLWYLGQDWVRSNIDDILPVEREAAWQTTMHAYLFYSSFHEDIYRLLRDHGDYLAALGTDFRGQTPKEHAAQHVLIAFFYCDEDMSEDGSLIRHLLEQGDAEHLAACVRWLLRQDRGTLDDALEKLRCFWAALSLRLSAHEQEPGYRDLICTTAELAKHLNELDVESTEWMKLAARNMGSLRYAVRATDQLVRLVEVSPAFVAEVMLAGLETSTTAFYDMEDVKKIVAELYESGLKEEADRICVKDGEGAVYRPPPTLRPA